MLRPLALLLSLSLSLVACGGASSADDGIEGGQALSVASEKLATGLQLPSTLTTDGTSVYFMTADEVRPVTASGFLYSIWVKGETESAKRLRAGLKGLPSSMTATKNGVFVSLLDSLVRIPLDGSTNGEVVYSTRDSVPDALIASAAADDNGAVIAVSLPESDVTDIVALSPDGRTTTRLATVPHSAGALMIHDGDLFIGNSEGEVFSVPRDASRAVTKVATSSPRGDVTSIVVSGTDVFFASGLASDQERIFVARSTGAAQLLAKGGDGPLVAHGTQLYYLHGKAVVAIPLAGGAPKDFLDLVEPSSLLLMGDSLIVTDTVSNDCEVEDGTKVCEHGVAYRVKL